MPQRDLPADAPDLRIVPVHALVPHELEDAQLALPLIKRLPQDGTLKNPPVVTPLNAANDRYVILDGTNRIIALTELGYPHALVQVVPYRRPHVELRTWNHVISGLSEDEIERSFRSLSGLEVSEADVRHTQAALARRTILAYCILADGRAISLAGGGLDLHERTRLLQAIVDVYHGRGRLHRTNLDEPGRLKNLYPDLDAAIVFPKYEPVEILDLAESGLPVPTGITRHVIHGRALRLNYLLDELAADTSIAAKNDNLRAWVRKQFNRRRVRYYAESTYLFDE